jgi:branched-chain amino acid transport system permease protein
MGSVLVAGLASGCLTGLVAMGIAMIFRTSGIVNFAQGEFMTVAAYAYIPLTQHHLNAGLEFAVIIGIGAVAGLVFFAITELFLARADHLIQVMSTFALSLLIVSVLARTKGSQTIPVPAWFKGGTRFTVAGMHLTGQQVIEVVVTLVLLAGLTAVLRATALGKAIEAVAEDRRAASLCGISPRRTVAVSWVIGGVLTAIAGLLYAPLSGVMPSMGANVLFSAFVATTIGGFVSITGAVVGGIAVGLVSSLSNYYLGGNSISTVAVFAILVVVLLVKPSGFGGRTELVRV